MTAAGLPAMPALLWLLAVGAPARPDLGILRQRLEAIAAAEPGITGVAVVHVEQGHAVNVRGDERFPMQSVYKLPIALAVLAGHEAGTLPMGRTVEVRAADVLAMPDGPTHWEHPPVRTTVRQLLELMIVESDNTACDKLMALAGGGPAVTRQLTARGLGCVTVSRPERKMTADFCRDARAPAPSSPCDLTEAGMGRAIQAQLARGQDVATPKALAALLVALQQGRLLSAPSTALLLDWMAATKPGRGRLKGQLPAGTRVAHRTGTGDLVVNDIGLVTLPDGQHLAIAVLMKLSPRPLEDRERTIAALARASYDFFTAQVRP
jgi:beta-lactamase class A